MKLSEKSRTTLELISAGHSYEQILSLHSDFTYRDIFCAAQEALELESPVDSTYQDRRENIRQEYPNAYESWTNEQDEILKCMHNVGVPVKAIASALKRQPGAIRSRIKKLGLAE